MSCIWFNYLTTASSHESPNFFKPPFKYVGVPVFFHHGCYVVRRRKIIFDGVDSLHMDVPVVSIFIKALLADVEPGSICSRPS